MSFCVNICKDLEIQNQVLCKVVARGLAEYWSKKVKENVTNQWSSNVIIKVS